MTDHHPLASLVARLLLSVVFITAGYGKLGDVAGFAGYMQSGGVPAFLAWPVIGLELLGGIAILAGFQTRLTALALAGFSIAAALLFHFVPADQMQMIMFMKNLGLAGGFLILAAHGAGAWSVDELVAGRKALA
ncbi:DoxX family protein [Defluviimonas sp. WL0024]|uniref:DoxX family protein n=2 Tax=Albidovulum TaxID=205889 RepID=A0ABT3IXI0_9RHOB|nr:MULTISPECIES: DoxX family protein [Defluviimonas]MCU9846571.1 DoxX family protein [Defluviimonas sp. WL0024]MCW3780150.1 DoxX family protein [Defluviimonas salinarum]